jgi:LAS superfamily LD-carboxypeptidase LdcB
MNRRTLIIATAAAGAVVVLGGAALIVLALTADASARADYDTAAGELAAATSALNDAQRGLSIAQQHAATTAQSARNVAAIDPALVDDATTVEGLTATIQPLVDAAQLVEVEGAIGYPAPLRGVLVLTASAPSDRDALTSAAANLRSAAKKLATQTTALTAQTTAIATADTDADAATAAVAAAAYRHGVAAVPPARASADSVAAYTAAVAALESPAADADLATLVLAYRDSWNAAVASDAAARSTTGAAEATYIKGVLIVNKTYGLPSTFGNGLTTETSNAFTAMQAAAATAGHNIYISSGYRSFSAQTNVYNKYKANEGQAGADTHSARPGHSEHQSGLAFDLNSITQAFGSTPEGIWTAQNAHLYGFIVRYPQGKESITGYIWEPWHLRYVGVDLATTLYTSGQTLEEYLGVDSVYS